MDHPLASITGNRIYIIWEVVDLMIHPLALVGGIEFTRPPFEQQETIMHQLVTKFPLKREREVFMSFFNSHT